MKGFRKKLFRFLMGSFLGWMTVVLGISLYLNRSVIGESEPWFWFLCGLGGGLLVFWKFRMIPVYVFGHELTHWLLAKLFRRKTSSFSVRGSSGSVRVANPNIWIVLGPYIFPIYVLLGLLVMFLVGQFSSIPPYIWLGCMAAFGCLYAYHIVLTIIALTKNQPDLTFNGKIFSLIFIIFFNMALAYMSVMLCGHGGNDSWQVPWAVMQDHASKVRLLVWWNWLMISRWW